MKNLPLVLSVGSLALLLGGCPSSNQANQSQPITQETPTPVPSPSPAVVKPPVFGSTTPTSQTPSVPSVAAGLIPATNPDQKRAEIARGRNDPFAPFPLQPIITIKPEVRPVLPSPRQSSQPAPRVTSRPQPPVKVALKPSLPSLPPPPPRPTEAQGVQVSGIVQLPSTPMAIVRAPGERTERRVIPGSTLSNGAVVVKSIDSNPDNPSIVLEQYGQTVTRRLGQGIQPPAANPQVVIIYDETGKGER